MRRGPLILPLADGIEARVTAPRFLCRVASEFRGFIGRG